MSPLGNVAAAALLGPAGIDQGLPGIIARDPRGRPRQRRWRGLRPTGAPASTRGICLISWSWNFRHSEAWRRRPGEVAGRRLAKLVRYPVLPASKSGRVLLEFCSLLFGEIKAVRVGLIRQADGPRDVVGCPLVPHQLPGTSSDRCQTPRGQSSRLSTSPGQRKIHGPRAATSGHLS